MPKDSGLQRLPPQRCEVLRPAFHNAYDNSTLIYDSVYQSGHRRLRLFFPKLLNNRQHLKDAVFRTDSETLKVSRWQYHRHFDTADFHFDKPPERLTLTLANCEFNLPVSTDECNGFEQCNVLFTLSKNNCLDWVRDWVQYHQLNHGADAVVFADNNSDAYTPQELHHAIASVDGIRRACVISTALRYGPGKEDCTHCSDAQFLQPALMNIMMARFMTNARAVLNADVDELVVSPDGTRIFDAAVRSLSGMVTFSGHWRYPGQTDQAIRHIDHTSAKATDKICPTKYAVNPAGRQTLPAGTHSCRY